jgi:nitroreductase
MSMNTRAHSVPRSDANPALQAYLKTRRSIPAFQMTEPGPDRETVESMIRMASRVPDHGKLTPWRFIAYTGDARVRLGEGLAAIARTRRADLSDKDIEIELTRFLRAPVVIGVISKAALHPKIPEWEQILSAGAVCLNLFMAANAHGFAANWLTEWYAYDREALPLLGVVEDERVAGFLHIGTPQMPPTDRPRPDVADTLVWVE